MFHFFLFCLIGCAFGQQVINESNDNLVPESPAAQYLGLAAGADSVVPNIRATFSCLGRNYGYFADVDNNCQIFHICHPSVDAKGEPVIYHFSKFCPKTTRFDQRQLTCLSETDPKLMPCGDSMRFFPQTEVRLAEGQVVQQLETIQQLPEVEQRVEQQRVDQLNRVEQRVEQQVLLEEPRNEALPVKGIQTVARIQPVLNEVVPAKTIARSEPIPQPIPQTFAFEQRAEPIQQIPESLVQRNEPIVQQIESLPQQRAEPIVQQIEPFEQRAEPLQPQTFAVKEPVVPIVQRSQALKQDLTPVVNTEILRAAAPAKNFVAPVLALRNTVSAPVSTPVQITRPVLVESDATLRRNVPLTQYTRQVVQPMVQPMYVQSQQVYQPQQFVQLKRYVQQQQQFFVPTVPQVIRPSQYRSVPRQQPRVVYIPMQTSYQTVPQYLRTNVQPVVQQVVRPLQNPIVARIPSNL